MTDSRTKNAIRNIFWGSFQKVIMILLPFMNRTLMIYMMGNEYIGLESLFKSILSVLNLTELGVGSALIYHMYKPIAQGDSKTICALMNFYKKCYRMIGGIVLGIGLVVMPFLQYLIKGTVPAAVNIYLLYFLYLLQTYLSYTLFAYKNSLLYAHQRRDIISKINIGISLVGLCLQAIILIVTRNIYLYVGVGMLIEISANVLQAMIVNQMYPKYQCSGEIDQEILGDVKRKVVGLMSTKVGGVIINSADSIIISAFLGLQILGIYNNYYYILVAIIGVLEMILSSLTPGIANSIVTKSVEKNYADFKKFTFMYQWLVSWCAACLLCLYQPFMKLWNPEGILPTYIVALLVLRFFAGRAVQMSFIYKDAMGLWWEDRYRPIVSALANLVINIILVKTIGIAGVIVSTFICSIGISTPWGNYILFKGYFKKGLKLYFIELMKCYFITFIVCAITYSICSLINADVWTSMFITTGICVIVPPILLAVCYCGTKEFNETLKFAGVLLKK